MGLKSKKCYLAGWGYTSPDFTIDDSRLQLGRVRVNTKKCKSTSYDSKKFICSSKSKGKTSKSTLPCAKDSGSGLFCCIEGKPYLYGTTSHGEKECYDSNGLGFYANIDDKNVLNWIQNVTNLKNSVPRRLQQLDSMNDFSSYC